MKDYRINIFYSEEDEAYFVDIPDLKFKICEYDRRNSIASSISLA